VSQTILATQVSVLNMSKELLLQHAEDVDALQNEEDEKKQTLIKDIDKEIECPRCYDMMILSSDFDRIGYFCHDCNLSLFIN
jgi:cytochrome c-type biogenesis protein CcmH/NrfF